MGSDLPQYRIGQPGCCVEKGGKRDTGEAAVLFHLGVDGGLN